MPTIKKTLKERQQIKKRVLLMLMFVSLIFGGIFVLYALYKKEIIKVDEKMPALHRPLSKIFILIFATFDFLRLPFSKTSQMRLSHEMSTLHLKLLFSASHFNIGCILAVISMLNYRER